MNMRDILLARALGGGAGGSGSLGGADWNASEGEPGHVLNRTHWVDVEKNKVFLDTTVTTTNNMAMVTLDGELQEVQTYDVTFAGQKYSCIAKGVAFRGQYTVIVGNAFAAGGENTAEPFAIAFVPATKLAFVVVLMQDGEYSVKVEGDMLTYHHIPKELSTKHFWIDFDLDNEVVGVTQLELNRAIDNGEMVTLRGRRPINGTVAMYYLDGRDQDGVVTFRDLATSYTFDLTPNDSGGYDMVHAT